LVDGCGGGAGAGTDGGFGGGVVEPFSGGPPRRLLLAGCNDIGGDPGAIGVGSAGPGETGHGCRVGCGAGRAFPNGPTLPGCPADDADADAGAGEGCFCEAATGAAAGLVGDKTFRTDVANDDMI